MDDQRYALNFAQLQRMLAECQRELNEARRDLENQRQLMLGIGQAFVNEALVEAASGDPLKFKNMPTIELANLIIVAGTRKMQRLTAFAEGLDPETRERALRRIITSDSSTWLDDPVVARLNAELEAARVQQRELEARVRALEAEKQDREQQLAEALRRCAVLQTNYADLQRQIEALVTARASAPEPPPPQPQVVPQPQEQSSTPPAQATPTATDGGDSPAVVTEVRVPPLIQQAVQRLVTERDTAGLESVPAEWRNEVKQLLLLLATRGICERPRLAHILATEYGVGNGDTNHLRVNQAFAQAKEAGLIEVIEPRSEIGIGRAPHLIRLTASGRVIAAQWIGGNPVPSELDQLLKMHDTPEHVVLILATRDLFLDKYPEPIKHVNILPVAVGIEGGKRYEPDLEVELTHGERLYVECERATPKNPRQRFDKWSKYYRVTQGNLYVVTPDQTSMTAIFQEISQWYFQHSGALSLKMTNVHAVLSGKPFWNLERIFKRRQ